MTGRAAHHTGVAARIRAALARMPGRKATVEQLRAQVPDATCTAISAMARAGILVKQGRRGRYEYRLGREPQRVRGAALGRARAAAKAPAVVVTPSHAAVQRLDAGRKRAMTSQEWEAQGGKVERLPRGAVSQSPLRFRYDRGRNDASD